MYRSSPGLASLGMGFPASAVAQVDPNRYIDGAMLSRKNSLLVATVLLLVVVGTAAPASEDLQEEAQRLASEGSRLLRAGEEDEALANFRAALRLAPELTLGHEGVGLVLFRQGDLPGSLQALNRAVAGRPDRCLSRGALARTQYAAGDADEAMQSLHEAVRRDETCVPARLFLANMYQARGDFALSAAVLAEVNVLAPQFRPAALQRAEVLHRAGRLPESIGVLAALPAGDLQERLPLFMAEMHMRMRRYGDAETLLLNYLRAMEQLPLTDRDADVEAEARELLARLLFETGRYGAALREAEASLAAAPERPMAHYILGKSLYMEGQKQRALVEINRARQGMGDAALEALPDLSVLYRRPSSQPADAFLLDVAPQMGLADSGKGRGSTWEDLDGDGRLDLLVGGQEFAAVAFLRLPDVDGHVVFREATADLGLGDHDSGYTHLVGDLNGDGYMDVYSIRGGYQGQRDGLDGNVLLLHQGDEYHGGPLYRRAGPEHGADHPGQGFGGALADFDGDGDLDIFIANYNGPNALLLNDGKAVFRDVSEVAGVTHAGGGQGVAVGDVDDDGDMDLFVANKHDKRLKGVGPGSVLYRNDGVGKDGIPRFSEIASQAGVQGNGNDFAPVLADLDNDGDLDLFVGAFNFWDGEAFLSWDGSPGGAHRLYRNDGVDAQGIPRFVDVGMEAGIDRVGGSMGASVGDLDNDGRLDLYVSMGGPEPGRFEPDLIFRNLGDLRFEEVAAEWGVFNPGRAHGTTLIDFDADGDLDVYVPNGAFYPGDGSPNRLYANQGARGRWLRLSLQGPAGNPRALGARVVVQAGEQRLLREVSAGHGFCSQAPPELHFGLGDAERYDSVVIRWPDGQISKLSGGPTNSVLTARWPESVGNGGTSPR